jgi:hypothetical protein
LCGKLPPDGGVIPCCSRHFWNEEFGDELDPDEDPVEVEPHPATASTVVSATAPMAVDLRDRRIKYVLLHCWRTI